MTKKKVSVILTVYNKPKWLRQCIESVNRQSYDNWELIIMEDNSPDPRVKEILQEYEHHPKMQVYYSEVKDEDRFLTARYATLINEAVRAYADGDYITYLADDDFYYDYRLERMVDVLSKYDRDVVVYNAQHSVDADGNVAGFRLTQGVLENAWDKVDHNSVMHSRSIFDKVDGWDDNIGTWGGADSYFWRKLSQAGILFVPLGDDMPGEAKRYHTDSVQWRMANKQLFPKGLDVAMIKERQRR
jgi:spore maturation protein CgeD